MRNGNTAIWPALHSRLNTAADTATAATLGGHILAAGRLVSLSSQTHNIAGTPLHCTVTVRVRLVDTASAWLLMLRGGRKKERNGAPALARRPWALAPLPAGNVLCRGRVTQDAMRTIPLTCRHRRQSWGEAAPMITPAAAITK